MVEVKNRVSINYYIREEDNILIREFSGEVTTKAILEAWEHDVNNGIIHSGLSGIINDYRNIDHESTCKKDIEELHTIDAFFNKHSSIFKRIRVGVVTECFSFIVLPLIFENRYSNHNHRTFSTIDGALHWMLCF